MSHTSASPVDAFATSDRLPVSGASSTGSSNNNINSNSTATSTSTGSSAAYPSAPDALGDSAGEHAASRSAFAEAPPGADATPPTTNTGPSSPALDLLHSHHHTDYANSPLASSRSRSLNDGLSPLPPPSHTAESSSSSSSLDAIAAMPVDPLASATQPAVTAAPIQRLLTALPVEALWRVFLATNSPKLVFNLLPRVCRRFHQTVRSFSVPMLANVDLLSEDEEDGGGANTPLLHTLEPARLLRAFRAVRVHPGCVDLADGEAAAGGRRGTTPPALSSLLLPSSPTSSPLSSSPLSGTPSPDLPLMHVAAERHIRVHISAIPDNPETLVEYVKQLLKRNAFGSHVKTPVRVVIGTVQVKGRRGNASADTVGSFLRSLRPINVTLWWWDSELIEKLQNVAMTLRLPNMRSDGHIQPRDMAVVARSTLLLRRLELFRPMPRQPWGLEASSFAPLCALSQLRELVVRYGRLVGSQEVLVASLIGLKELRVLELPWNLDSRRAARVLLELPHLQRIQYVHVNSPDFFQWLPSYFESNLQNLLLATPASSSPITAGTAAAAAAVALRRAPAAPHHPQQPPPQQQQQQQAPAQGSPRVTGLRCAQASPSALTSLRALGLNYMEPDPGDVAVMIEGVIRCFPCLDELHIRVNVRPNNDSNYDFFNLPRDFLERCFRRLEQRTTVREVSLELGLRMWASRRSYADELTAAFAGSRIKLRISSPVGWSG